MEGLCKYKDSLGIPGQGFHEPRFAGMAAGDLFGTLLICWGISAYWDISLLIVIIIIFIFTIGIHKAFCVNTALNKSLGLGYED
jgi:hypothetical protein